MRHRNHQKNNKNALLDLSDDRHMWFYLGKTAILARSHVPSCDDLPFLVTFRLFLDPFCGPAMPTFNTFGVIFNFWSLCAQKSDRKKFHDGSAPDLNALKKKRDSSAPDLNASRLYRTCISVPALATLVSHTAFAQLRSITSACTPATTPQKSAIPRTHSELPTRRVNTLGCRRPRASVLN